MKYLGAYPASLQSQVKELMARGDLGPMLEKKYAGLAHNIRTDLALYGYVLDLKNKHLRKASPVSKVGFDNRLHVIQNALGTHTSVSRVQGSKLKAKREIRIGTLFKDVPEPLLKMIVVHELAHLKEREHDKAFYQLCTHMEPDYHQLELDLRLVLTHQDEIGPIGWDAPRPVGPLT